MRALNFNIHVDKFTEAIREGKITHEGKRKIRVQVRTKKGAFVAIGIENPESYEIITITKVGQKQR